MKPSGKYLNLGDKVQTYINYSNKFLIIQYVFNQTPFYDKVVSLGKNAVKGSSVCIHRLLAVNHYNFFKTLWQYLTKNDPSGCLRLQSEP